MFYGEYTHNLDEKGRLIIPSKLRMVLKDGYIDKFYLTRGLEGCVFAYAEAEWNLLRNKIKSLSLMKANARAFTRMLFSGAFEVECDKQGRINIPPTLIAYAGIQKEVTVVGVLNRLEIWDSTRWKNFYTSTADSYEKLAEDLVDFNWDDTKKE